MKDGALKLQGRPTLTRGQHKSGRKLYVEMTFALVMADGVAQGSVAIARDVTERTERERERRRNRIVPLRRGRRRARRVPRPLNRGQGACSGARRMRG